MHNSINLILLAILLLGGCRQVSETQPTQVGEVEVKAGKAGEVSLHSNLMNKDISLFIATPKNYNDRSINSFPVLYLLHGAYGDHMDWQKSAPLQAYADTHGLIIVCPDGHEFGWYLDSPVDSLFRYESFVTQELLPWIDQNYKTSGKRDERAICGLSMGGHGAFYLAFRHPDLWSACGGISGGMDLRPFPKSWELGKRLGEQVEGGKNWLRYSVMGQLDSLKNNQLAIYFDCGTDDFFFEVNEALHDSLTRRRITHTYTTRPGEHNWEYFAASLPAHLEFFDRAFEE